MHETEYWHVKDKIAAAKTETTEKKFFKSPIFIESLHDSDDGLPSADERFYGIHIPDNLTGHQALGYTQENPSPLLTKSVNTNGQDIVQRIIIIEDADTKTYREAIEGGARSKHRRYASGSTSRVI